MSGALSSGERIEIRGFGSFSLHYRPPRTGRNPKTGESVSLAGKHVPHFKPGKELRDRVNQAFQELQDPGTERQIEPPMLVAAIQGR
jgi:integration host factor subunit beta